MRFGIVHSVDVLPLRSEPSNTKYGLNLYCDNKSDKNLRKSLKPFPCQEENVPANQSKTKTHENLFVLISALSVLA